MTTQSDSLTTTTAPTAPDSLTATAAPAPDSLLIMAPPAPDSLPEAELPGLLDAPDTVLLVSGRLQGETGRPQPYTMRGDTLLTSCLLAVLCIYILLVGRFTRFLSRQLKDFFYPADSDDDISDTSSETYSLWALSLLDSVMLAFATYLTATQYFHVRFDTDRPSLIIAVLCAAFVLFFLARLGLYATVNTTFFGKKKNLQWTDFILFVTACEGVLLLPAVIMQAYFEVDIEFTTIYYGIVLFLNKILTFYKAWLNFFRQSAGFLQTFLYFCALEIITSLTFVAALCYSIDEIKINF